ncbi:MAG: nuclear transport factor 2 family protein [Pontixanthobacter sp.]
MDDPEDRLLALEDRAAIEALIASYGPLADSGDAAGVARLWTDDGTYNVGGFGTATGHREIAALIEGPTHQELMHAGCAHVLSPHVITLDGERASATGYSVVFRKQGDAFQPWRVSANRWELTRTRDGWRVQHRDNAPLDGSEAARALLSVRA